MFTFYGVITFFRDFYQFPLIYLAQCIYLYLKTNTKMYVLEKKVDLNKRNVNNDFVN